MTGRIKLFPDGLHGVKKTCRQSVRPKESWNVRGYARTVKNQLPTFDTTGEGSIGPFGRVNPNTVDDLPEPAPLFYSVVQFESNLFVKTPCYGLKAVLFLCGRNN